LWSTHIQFFRTKKAFGNDKTGSFWKMVICMTKKYKLYFISESRNSSNGSEANVWFPCMLEGGRKNLFCRHIGERNNIMSHRSFTAITLWRARLHLAHFHLTFHPSQYIEENLWISPRKSFKLKSQLVTESMCSTRNWKW
jgi:hypothetical protein